MTQDQSRPPTPPEHPGSARGSSSERRSRSPSTPTRKARPTRAAPPEAFERPKAAVENGDKSGRQGEAPTGSRTAQRAAIQKPPYKLHHRPTANHRPTQPKNPRDPHPRNKHPRGLKSANIFLTHILYLIPPKIIGITMI
ncbi:hypothetical protein [Thermofilum sp.]|uniref:hypothetical protein n=1 Tax=Thermofilum sp. TaxID=1961369 RepID=UPI003166B324